MRKPSKAAAPAPRRRDIPNTRKIMIIAQDPAVKVGGKILTTEIEVPAEELLPGPCGYRVNVIDYDASTGTLYTASNKPLTLPRSATGAIKRLRNHNARLTGNPHFHAYNVYAIVMKTLARFEFALGRRVPWGSDGHQLHVAPHAFADANAFYSKDDRGLFFGYFTDQAGEPVFTCLSHDVVAHETTHALLDGLRRRYLEPSSPDQAAFHEGFADIVALLSVFSQQDVVAALLAPGSAKGAKLIDQKFLTVDALKESVLFGLAKQMGAALSGIRGNALRRSVSLPPGRPYLKMKEFEEPHSRGEIVVAAMLNSFIHIWISRLEKIGYLRKGMKDLSLVVEEGARVADHLLTMAIRALDYCPPTDINFPDFLSALLTIDHEVVPDDSKYGYRGALLRSFADYDIRPAAQADHGGVWKRFDKPLRYNRTHFDSMLRDKEEVFRFIWENRPALGIGENGYIEVETVCPSRRVGPDGFILHETIAEFVQILTVQVGELKGFGITPPKGMPKWRRVRLFGGGALIFDEYGQVKYMIGNSVDNYRRQGERLRYLWNAGYFDQAQGSKSQFAQLHLARAAVSLSE
jgi:hypothetical protein